MKMSDNTKEVLSTSGVEIIDNWMPLKEFEKMQESIMEGGRLPLFFSKNTLDYIYRGQGIADRYHAAKHKYPYPETEGDYGLRSFGHEFITTTNMHSEHLSIIHPVLNRLRASAIIRAKLNFTPPTAEHRISGWHLDTAYSNLEGQKLDLRHIKVALLYITSNNGYTLLEDGTKIKSVANRLLIFPSEILHTGVSHVDPEGMPRVTLNTVFVPSMLETGERNRA